MGLILCAEKDHAVAKYALEGLPNKVLATEYRTKLPKERLLVEAIEKTKRQLQMRAYAKPKPATKKKTTAKRKPATKARKGINPFTGEETIFKAKPARNVVKIRPLKKMKDMVA